MPIPSCDVVPQTRRKPGPLHRPCYQTNTVVLNNMFTEVHVNFNAWVCARTPVPREVVFMNDYDVQQDTVDPSAKDESLLVDP